MNIYEVPKAYFLGTPRLAVPRGDAPGDQVSLMAVTSVYRVFTPFPGQRQYPDTSQKSISHEMNRPNFEVALSLVKTYTSRV